MQTLQHIEGMQELLEKLPPHYQHWHLFGNIQRFHYECTFDEAAWQPIACIRMVLTDQAETYKIGVLLKDVVGDIGFNVTNGFFSGLTIYDRREQYIVNGWEPTRCFLVTDSEQDVAFAIECEAIAVTLLEDASDDSF